ncbi:hypothetical protein OROHE_005527 [Orobanche hederae]
MKENMLRLLKKPISFLTSSQFPLPIIFVITTMASTLEEVKWSGGSEQKSGGGSGKDGSSETREEQQMEEGGSEAVPVYLKKQKEDNNEQGGGSGGGSGKDGSSKTREEQQKEEDGGSEEVPVDLKNPKAYNNEQGGSGGGSGKDDDGSSSGTDSSSKTKKPWYLVSPTDLDEDEDEVDEDEEERSERKEGIYYIRGGYGLSYAMETDNAVAFIYIMRYFAARDSEAEDMYLVQAIRGEKYSIVKFCLLSCGRKLLIYWQILEVAMHCILRVKSNTKYRDGLTPIDVAKIRGLHEVLGLLNEIARSVRNAKANLSEANLSEDKTAGSSTKLAETNPSKKQKMQV